jgi:hypothetical protein
MTGRVTSIVPARRPGATFAPFHPDIRARQPLARVASTGCMVRPATVAILLAGTAAAAWRLRRGGRDHAHHCFLCDGTWTHAAPCTEGPARLCPWCLADSRTDGTALPEAIVSRIREIGPARRGRHAHHCSVCLVSWTHRHGERCTAGDRAALADCPGCRRLRVALPNGSR